jgi:hypothetical protein
LSFCQPIVNRLSPWRGGEERVELLGRRLLEAGQDVRVRIQRDAHTGVPDSIQYNLGVDAGAEHQGGVGMAKVMDPEAGC